MFKSKEKFLDFSLESVKLQTHEPKIKFVDSLLGKGLKLKASLLFMQYNAMQII